MQDLTTNCVSRRHFKEAQIWASVGSRLRDVTDLRHVTQSAKPIHIPSGQELLTVPKDFSRPHPEIKN
jgi:hypothetical protein